MPGVLCEPLVWGGVRVTLCEDVFEAHDERVAEQWMQAMAAARDERVFATAEIRSDGATSFVRGSEFAWPDDYRP